ncbi:hypothetical protein B9Z19DRAFT_1130253 [Tuber borchii]|uniref:S1 motif domain-containing protein n=1 Tax=Tuber borchii TaxID=42251 RepID=A0A2T6ZKT1_TUBBO|nr:hypothetical protein B9Z19DRAFT_1130253 [Tuber borchii]
MSMFFSDVCGFLPVSEMSESYIQDPREHLTVGQSGKVYVLSVDPANQKPQKEALAKLPPGGVVSRTAIEKSAEVEEEPDVEIDGIIIPVV